MTAAEKLKMIEAFSLQPNKLLDKQRITEERALMYPVFEHALNALKSVLDSSDEWVSENEGSREKDFYGYGNNVIAFCAPRGQGKTSTMLSLTHALKHCNSVGGDEYCYREARYCERLRAPEQTQLTESKKLWGDTVHSRNFLVVPPIDPTVLDKNESVVGLILAWLFQEINNKWKKCDELPPERIESEQLEVLKHFQKCKECLVRHNGAKEEDFSDLIKSSIVFEVKAHFNAIIECYFRLCGQSQKKNYLIIQLDDTDMDMVNSYDVLEDVRKFLSVPRTVVMMATYLRQLRMLVAKHYEETLGNPHGEGETRVDYIQMAAKYIDKLIPSQQMIHINSFRHQRDLTGALPLHAFQPDCKEDGDLEQAFLDMIQERTGLVFLLHRSYVSNILPTTLRGLVHLYQLLENMRPIPSLDIVDTASVSGFRVFKELLQIRQHNLLLFEDYFRNDWCYANLEEKDQEIMWIISHTHIAPKLQIIRNLLFERWTIHEWKDMQEITDLHKAPSFHKIVKLLEEAEHHATDMNDLILNFAVRTHLSITLHKLYLSDLLTCLKMREDGFTEKNIAQQSLGSFIGIDFSQLKSYLNFANLAIDNDKSYCDLKEGLEEIGEQSEFDDKIKILYEVIFNTFLISNQKKDVNLGAVYTLPQYNRTCFALQEAAFRVLGNHDILRLWLNTDPDRFSRCQKYVTGGKEEEKRSHENETVKERKSTYPISFDAQDSIVDILELLNVIRTNLFHQEKAPDFDKAPKQEEASSSSDNPDPPYVPSDQVNVVEQNAVDPTENRGQQDDKQ